MSDTAENKNETSEAKPSQEETPDTDTDTSQDKPEGTTEAAFTQADVDRIVGDRAKRAKEAGKSELLQELGVEDPDALKSLIADYKKRKEAEMSEAEKALAEVEKERKKREDAEEQLASLQSTIKAQAREGAFKDALRKAGAEHEDDLHILVQAKMQETYMSAFDEDGKPLEKQLDALIKQVQADYGTYFKTAGAGNPSKAGGIAPTSQAEATKEAEKTVNKKFGKL